MVGIVVHDSYKVDVLISCRAYLMAAHRRSQTQAVAAAPGSHSSQEGRRTIIISGLIILSYRGEAGEIMP